MRFKQADSNDAVTSEVYDAYGNPVDPRSGYGLYIARADRSS
jgi:hypothetical protein